MTMILKEAGNMTEVYYKSTRDKEVCVKASEAVLQGLSHEGGLFVPDHIPELDLGLDDLAKLDYKETAYEVMKLYLSDYTEAELKECINKAYDEKFDTAEIAPLAGDDGIYFLELFHGATIAFKDMALSILPHLMTTAAKKNKVDDETVILTATSGDTGKAALAGFADVPGIRIMVYYPDGGVSHVQKLQMVTQKGDNTCVVAVRGNFDDCQSRVKQMFADKSLGEKLKAQGFRFSSANSINIGRLVPQIVYYVYAYASLIRRNVIKAGDKVDFCVPTGNFGNILACYYAKQMGLPVNRLICASNENKVLFDFFSSGVYDKNRSFILTSSPSMDILISSNLERLIYHAAGDDADKNAGLMKELSETGKYIVDDDMRGRLTDFVGFYSTDEEGAAKIKELYDKKGYVIDTHTAVAASCYDKYREAYKASVPAVIVSTASPYKFSASVLSALEKKELNSEDVFGLTEELNRLSGVKIPRAIEELRDARVLHDIVCDADKMRDVLENFLKKA